MILLVVCFFLAAFVSSVWAAPVDQACADIIVAVNRILDKLHDSADVAVECEDCVKFDNDLQWRASDPAETNVARPMEGGFILRCELQEMMPNLSPSFDILGVKDERRAQYVEALSASWQAFFEDDMSSDDLRRNLVDEQRRKEFAASVASLVVLRWSGAPIPDGVFDKQWGEIQWSKKSLRAKKEYQYHVYSGAHRHIKGRLIFDGSDYALQMSAALARWLYASRYESDVRVRLPMKFVVFLLERLLHNFGVFSLGSEDKVDRIQIATRYIKGWIDDRLVVCDGRDDDGSIQLRGARAVEGRKISSLERDRVMQGAAVRLLLEFFEKFSLDGWVMSRMPARASDQPQQARLNLLRRLQIQMGIPCGAAIAVGDDAPHIIVPLVIQAFAGGRGDIWPLYEACALLEHGWEDSSRAAEALYLFAEFGKFEAHPMMVEFKDRCVEFGRVFLKKHVSDPQGMEVYVRLFRSVTAELALQGVFWGVEELRKGLGKVQAWESILTTSKLPSKQTSAHRKQGCSTFVKALFANYITAANPINKIPEYFFPKLEDEGVAANEQLDWSQACQALKRVLIQSAGGLMIDSEEDLIDRNTLLIKQMAMGLRVDGARGFFKGAAELQGEVIRTLILE